MKNNFSERVVQAACSIPRGRVSTYGRIARASGGGMLASRSITSILAKAYEGGVKNIPFHRIVYADGRVWTNASHKKERMALYKKEGIEVGEKGRIKNFSKVIFEFE